MCCKVKERVSNFATGYLEFIVRWAWVFALLGLGWLTYSIIVMLDFTRQMVETVTPHQRAAITEAGVESVLLGDCLIALCLTLQFLVWHFFVMQISATPKGEHVAMHDAARQAVVLSDMPAGSSTTVSVADE